MPESCKNRFTNSYEIVIHAIKTQRNFFKKLRINKSLESISSEFRGRSKQHKYTGYHTYGGGGNIKKERLNYIQIQQSARENNHLLLDLHIQDTDINQNTVEFHSKFLSPGSNENNNGSIAGRVIQGLQKNHKVIREAIQNINQYLKKQLNKSPYNLKQLAKILEVSEDTLSHYFRIDLSGCAIPTEDVWNAIKPLLGLDEYQTRVKEEYTRVLPVISPYAYMSNVIQVNNTGLKDNHYAVYPEDMVRLLIEAGSPYRICNQCGYKLKEPSYACPECKSVDLKQSVILDPFLGSGTTALVAEKMGRKWIGIEISEVYASIIDKRINTVQLELVS